MATTAKRKKKPAAVGTARIEPGKSTTGELVLGHYPDGPIASPVIVASGKQPGPTFWIQGCVHGAEVGGPVSLLRFLDGLDLRTLKGAVVAVLLANPTAFRTYGRFTPMDGANLNRVFPGDAAGSHTQQMADVLCSTALAVADAVLDLHSGGDRSIVPFYALYRNDGSAASKAAAKLARAAGTPDIWASTDAWLTGALFTIVTAKGIPGLIVECGGGSQVPDEHIASYVGAMTGMAQELGMLPGKPPRQKKYRVVDDALLVYSHRGGLFLPAVQAGDVVRKGQELGRCLDLYGNVAEVVKSPISAGWIGSIRRRYMPVYSGDQIAEVIHIQEDR
jgi:hypothetical protein